MTTRTYAAGRWWMVVLAVAMGLLASTPVDAQFGMGNSEFMTPITKRGIKNYARLLRMDEEQLENAMTLFEGYQVEFRGVMKDMERAFKKFEEEVEESRDYTIYQKEMPKLMKTMTERMESLEDGFLGDMKLLLAEEQAANWERVERLRRRETGLRFGFVSGAAVDVVEAARKVGVEEGASPELGAALGAYESDIDKLLVQFETMGKEAQEDMMKDDNPFDFTKMQEMMKKVNELSVQLRNANRDHARKVAAVMPEETRAKFEAEVQRRSFPRVYRKVHVVKALDAAAAFSDLDEAQRATLAQIRETYDRESASASQKWASAIQTREDKDGGRWMAMMSGTMGEAEDDPVAIARKARRELDARTKDKLLAALREDQKTRLPVEEEAAGGEGRDLIDIDFEGIEELEGLDLELE